MKRKLSLVVVLALLVSMFAVTAMADTTATVDLANGTYTISVDATVDGVTYDKASVMVTKPGKHTAVNGTHPQGVYTISIVDNDLLGVFDYLDVIEGATDGKFTFTKTYSVEELYGTYGVYVGLYNAAGYATQSTTSLYGDILGVENSSLMSLKSGTGKSGDTKYVSATADFTADKANYRVFIATYNAQGGIENIGISEAPVLNEDSGEYRIYTQLNDYSDASTSYKVFLWDVANGNKPVTKVIAGTI